MSKSISVIGLGKLGAPMAACFAAKGFRVVGVDADARKVEAINRHESPHFESNLPELLASTDGRFSATQDIEAAVIATDVSFLVVATPSEPDGSFSLRYVLPACEQIGRALREKKAFHVIALTSTVMPGSTGGKVQQALERASGKRAGKDFGLCYNPEFIALGSVIRDFLNPDFLLIGESDSISGNILEKIYRQVCENSPPVARLNLINAEIAKLAVNTYVTTKISFANMLARICERLPEASVDAVTVAVGMDGRIGQRYLRGAISYGGPCFPRDNRALAILAEQVGAPADIARATDKFNRAQIRWLAELAQGYLSGHRTVGILGLTYKPHTDVLEEAPGLLLARELTQRGVSVSVFDPSGQRGAVQLLGERVAFAASAAECIAGADVVVIATPWPEFARIERAQWARASTPRTVIDCWRSFLSLATAEGVKYVCLGAGATLAAVVPPAESGFAATLKTETLALAAGPNDNGSVQRVNILGVGVSAVNMDMAVAKIQSWVERREPNYVIAAPAHCLVECLRDEQLRRIYNQAGMVTPDGMPVAWITRLMGHPRVDRVYGPDLMLAVCERSVPLGYKHFLYGGWPPNVVEKLAVRLRERFPGIRIVGTHAPPFRPLTPDEDAEIIEKINLAKPDIVWIGLGAAKEEPWAASHIGMLVAPVLIGVGAGFDFLSGTKPQAPRWMMRAGLEWFFRVLTEPRRLGPRYLKDNPVFLWHILRQGLGKAPRPLRDDPTEDYRQSLPEGQPAKS